MGLLGEMIAGGVAGYAGSRYDDLEKQIAMERQQALEDMREDRAAKRKDDERKASVDRVQGELKRGRERQAERVDGLISTKTAAIDANTSEDGESTLTTDAQGNVTDTNYTPEEGGRRAAAMRAQGEKAKGLILEKPYTRSEYEEVYANTADPMAKDLATMAGQRETAGREERRLDLNDEDRRADNRRADRQLELAERNSAASASLQRVQLEVAKLSLARSQEEQKIPAAVSKAFDAAKANYHDSLKIASSADFNEHSDIGKRVLADMQRSSNTMQELMKPYLPKSESKGGDLDALRKIMLGEKAATAEVSSRSKPAESIAARDMGYSPENATQFQHVLDSLNNPSMRAQAMYWLESGGLTLGQKATVRRALGG